MSDIAPGLALGTLHAGALKLTQRMLRLGSGLLSSERRLPNLVVYTDCTAAGAHVGNRTSFIKY